MNVFRTRLTYSLLCLWVFALGSSAEAAELIEDRIIGGPARMTMYPSGVTVDPSTGNLIVADTGNDRLLEYSAAGTLLRTFGGFGRGTGRLAFPRTVDMDGDGNIYVMDASNGRVVKLRRDLSWVASWAGPTGNGPTYGMGISVKGDKVYVTWPGRGVRVWNLDLNKELLFIKPNGVCNFGGSLRDADADSAGNVYISDYHAKGVFVVGPDGKCLRKLTGGKHAAYAVRVAYDPVLKEELLYERGGVTDPSVRVFRLDGSYVGGTSSSAFFYEARFMDVAPDGDIWVADFHGNRIKRFDRRPGGWVEAQRIPANSPPNAVAPKPLADDAMFNTVRNITFGADGTVYAADFINNRIVHFTSDGRAINACLERKDLAWPKGIAVDLATDEIWYSAPGYNHLGIIRPDCSTVVATLKPEAFGFTPFADPQGLAIRAADRVAFVVDKGHNRIVAYDVASRKPLAAIGSRGVGINQFNDPRDVAIHPASGTVLVADSKNQRIVELAFEGGAFRWLRTIGAGLIKGAPLGVAADRAGRVYVADTNRNQVLVIDDRGALLSTLAGLGEPNGIAVSPADEVFVADTRNDRIRVYAYPTANLLVNGGFENDFAAWNGVGPGKPTTSEVHSGAKAAVFSGAAAFKHYLYRSVRGAPAGSYNGSIWYKRVGSVNGAHLSIKVVNVATGVNQYVATAGMTTTGAWTRVALNAIPVKAGEVVQYGVWMDMGAGGALYLDDAELQ